MGAAHKDGSHQLHLGFLLDHQFLPITLQRHSGLSLTVVLHFFTKLFPLRFVQWIGKLELVSIAAGEYHGQNLLWLTCFQIKTSIDIDPVVVGIQGHASPKYCVWVEGDRHIKGQFSLGFGDVILKGNSL